MKNITILLAIFILCFISSLKAVSPIYLTTNGSLPSFLSGSSGVDYDGSGDLWTLNDHGDKKIYNVTDNGTHITTTYISGASVTDWEDMTHDINRQNMYIADVGNNGHNRTNLKIYKIPYPTSNSTETAQTINFSYPNGGKYDCESIYHRNGFIFLFTKSNPTTKLFKIPDSPGTHTAVFVSEFSTHDNVTSADISPDGSTVVLLAERSLSSIGQPGQYESRLHLFNGFTGNNPFNGSHTILAIANNYTQKEAVCFSSNDEIYLTNEGSPKIYYLDISMWISMITNINETSNLNFYDLFETNSNILLYDIKGSFIKAINNYQEDIKELENGIYIFVITKEGTIPKSYKFTKMY